MSNPQVPISGSLGAAGPFPTLGGTVVTLADANHTLIDPSETCYLYILVKGALTAARNITAPNNTPGFTYIVINETTGGFSINFGGSTGSGVTIQNGAGVIVATDGVNYSSPSGGSGGAGFSIGMSAIGNTLFVEAGTDWINVPAGSTVNLFTLLPFIASNGEVVAGSSNMTAEEQVTMAVLYDVQALATADLGHWERRITGRSDGTTILNAEGTSTDTDVTSPPPTDNEGTSLVGTVAAITVSGTTLTTPITAPASIAMQAGVSVSYVRRSPGTLPAAPTLSATSVNNGPAEGGTAFVLTGTNLSTVYAVDIVAPGPTVIPVASFTYNSGTGQLDCVSGATIVGGVCNIVVHAPGGTATLTGAWTYNLDSLTIFGANAHIWKGSGLVQSAGVVTAWNDQQTVSPINLVPQGSPVYNASSATWTPPQPSVSFNGTSMYFNSAAGDTPAGVDLFAWAILRCTDVSTYRDVFIYESHAYFDLRIVSGSGNPEVSQGVRAVVDFPTNVVNTNVLITGYSDDASVGAGGVSSVSVDNATPATVTGLGISLVAGGSLLVGVRDGGPFFFEGEMVEIGFCWFPSGTGPTSTQLTQLAAYAAAQYGT